MEVERLTDRQSLDPAGNGEDYVKVLTTGGPKVTLKKVEILPGASSQVPVGTSIQGKLRNPITVGNSVSFCFGSGSLSHVKKIEIDSKGVVLLQTGTSVYRLDIDDSNFVARLRSLQYLRRGYLDFDEVMPDGFYDGGHSMTFSIQDGRLDVNRGNREFILVNAERDHNLAAKVACAREFVASATMLQARVQMLAMFVSNLFGGSQMVKGGDIDFSQLVEEDVQQHFTQVRGVGNAVLLGSLNYGFCRHRAILFKYLADRLGIPSRLVRGKQSDWHVWNIVNIDGKNYVVDVMQQPWKLLEEDSRDVEHYRRVFMSRVGKRVYGGIGGHSIGMDSEKS